MSRFSGVENCSVAMLGLDHVCGWWWAPKDTVYEMGSHTGCSERHLYKHYWICRKNQLVRIVLRELVGKIWHILLSSWVDLTAVTPQRCHCFQGCSWEDLCSCSSHWGMEFRRFLLSGRKELAVSDTTLLQKFSFGSMEHLKGKITVARFVSAHSKLYCAERKYGVMVRLSPSEVPSCVTKFLFLILCF